VAVTLAAREHRVTRLAAQLTTGARWAVAGHVLDFDDLHMPSTTHVSVVCVPTALATDGGARAYLAAAGVMARLGTALGWRHYSAGWHATCTAGAPAAAAGAAVAFGLPAERIAAAMALAVPAAGGVQRAFGTDAKSAAGRLRGGGGNPGGPAGGPRAPRPTPPRWTWWLGLVGGDPSAGGPVWALEASVPNGLAIKLYPCCYALQRPISALAELSALSGLSADPAAVRRIVLRTPEATVVPLIHQPARLGAAGQVQPGVRGRGRAAGLLRRVRQLHDEAVRRDEARRLVSVVETKLDPGGDWLLDGELEAEVHPPPTGRAADPQQYPPGSPARPPTPEQLAAKLADAWPVLTPTRPNGPGRMRRRRCGGGCRARRN